MDNASAAETNLRWLLRPIDALLADPAMTDLYINGPGEGRCFIDRGHGMERLTLPYTFDDLEDIAINAAALDPPGHRRGRAAGVDPLPGRAAGADRPSPGGRGRPVRLLHPPAQTRDLDTGRSGRQRCVRPGRRTPRTTAATTRTVAVAVSRGGMAGLPRTGGRRAAQHRLLRHRGLGQDTQPQGLHPRDPRAAGGW